MSNPTDFPEPADFASGGRAKGVEEPIVKATIIVPESQSSLPPFCFARADSPPIRPSKSRRRPQFSHSPASLRQFELTHAARPQSTSAR